MYSSAQAKQVVSSFRDSVYSQWKWVATKDMIIQKMLCVSYLCGTYLSFQVLRRLRQENVCATK